MKNAVTMYSDVKLLQRAGDYAVSAVDTVTVGLLSQPTPCSEWDLRMLLEHATESVAALHEGLDSGRVGLFSTVPYGIPANPVLGFRACVARLVDEWVAGHTVRTITVADRLIPLPLAAGVAAVEIAVHGWDIAQASGLDRPIPPALAMDLLAISTLLLSDGNRHPLFAPPVRARALAGPSEKLLAFLGRPCTVGSERPPSRTDSS
jgi:uncharacterized protein (TIGR03086 family)